MLDFFYLKGYLYNIYEKISVSFTRCLFFRFFLFQGSFWKP